METATKIRDRVQESYTEAVQSSTGCCSETSCCGSEVEQKGVAAKLAGYSADELAALPDDAVANSFGCGNPVAFADVAEGETVLDLGSGAGIDLLTGLDRHVDDESRHRRRDVQRVAFLGLATLIFL